MQLHPNVTQCRREALTIAVDLAQYMTTNSIICATVTYAGFAYTDAHHTWPNDVSIHLSSSKTWLVGAGWRFDL